MRYTMWKIVFVGLIGAALVIIGTISLSRLRTSDSSVIAIRTHWIRGAWTKFTTLLDISRGLSYRADDLLPCTWDMSVSQSGHMIRYQNCEGNTYSFLYENVQETSFSPVDERGYRVSVNGSFEWSNDDQLLFLGGSSDSDVYVWDGIVAWNISQNDEDDYSPTWSVDGRIAFVSENALFVWTGGEVMKVFDSAFSYHAPDWSLDGKLAFVSWNYQDKEINVWDGDTITNVTQNLADDYDPAWGPDGQLAFVSERNHIRQIFIWQDGQPTVPLDASTWQSEPTWHPNGSLAYITDRPENGFGVEVRDGQAVSSAGYFYSNEEFEAMDWISMAWK